MSWREQFENLEGLQEIIDNTLKILNDGVDVNATGVDEQGIALELKKAVDNQVGKVIDFTNQEKFLYAMPDQVKHFVSISSSPNHSGLEKLLSLQGEKFKDTSEIIDYGCGNAIKSSWIYHYLNELLSSENRRTLFLLDYNKLVLNAALNITQDLGIPQNNLGETQNINLVDHHVVRRDKNQRLHFLLGQTIGNFEDPHPVAQNIAQSMRKGEYLIVEWFNHKPTDYEEEDLGERTLQLLYNYFNAAKIPPGIIGVDENKHFMEEKIDKMNQVWNQGYLVFKNDFEIEKENPEDNISFSKGTKLIGLKSRHFKDYEIMALFEEYGLQTEIIETTYSSPSLFGLPEREPHKCLNFNNQRYAIFKKTKEWPPKHRAKLLIGGLLLGAVLSVAGLYNYENENIVPCDETVLELSTLDNPSVYPPENSLDTTIICKQGAREISMPLERISIKHSFLFGKGKNDLLIGFKEENYVLNLDWRTKNLIQGRYKLLQKCRNFVTDLVRPNSNTSPLSFYGTLDPKVFENLESIARSTRDPVFLFKTYLFLEAYRLEGMENTSKIIASALASKAGLTQSSEKTNKLINYFSHQTVLNRLRKKENITLQSSIGNYTEDIGSSIACVPDVTLLLNLENLVKDYKKQEVQGIADILKIISHEACSNSILEKIEDLPDNINTLVDYFSSPEVIALLKDAEIKDKDYNIIHYKSVVKMINSFFKYHELWDNKKLIQLASYYLKNSKFGSFEKIFKDLEEIKSFPKQCVNHCCLAVNSYSSSSIDVIEKYKDFEYLSMIMGLLKEVKNKNTSVNYINYDSDDFCDFLPKFLLNNCVHGIIIKEPLKNIPLFYFINSLSQSNLVFRYGFISKTESFAYATGVCKPQDYSKLLNPLKEIIEGPIEDDPDNDPYRYLFDLVKGFSKDKKRFLHEIDEIKKKSFQNNFMLPFWLEF